MAKRLSKVKIIWNVNFAYAIGLITTDGNLSIDGRHISFTTKDKQLASLFKKCLGLNNKIGKKSRGHSKIKKYYVIQFGDVNLYEYLQTIGLTPTKSKTIREIDVPDKYFADFLRGCLDGDGNISIFNHPESKHKQLKVRFTSASEKFLLWIHNAISKKYKINGGYIYKDKIKSVSTLSYAKNDGGKILKLMYYRKNLPFLKRKKDIFDSMLGEW
ncbi:MAG: Uncharacterized protein CEO12_608 [Parcubacteria group bacterium Gr01-1014_46]|nr:MAG: Uncharacterized protein CEO12_608 [Parcubacteria group bacterium Gr01-1014_46]